MNKPKWSHYQAVVKILRYIKGTLRYEVLFPSGVRSDAELICYSDSDLYGDGVDRRNTSGYFYLYLESPIFLCFKKQLVVVLSICEALKKKVRLKAMK